MAATTVTAASAPAASADAGPAPPPQESGPTFYASSTGLDFIDLVHLDERVVHTRLHEAVLFRTLVCSGGANSACPTWRRASFTAAPIGPAPPAPSQTCGVPVTPAAAEPINVKRLKSYRDHVTRNLAPTVAKGFATAARAAGIILAAPPPSATATTATATATVPPPQPSGSPTAAAPAPAGNTAVGPAGSAISTGGAASSPAIRQPLQKQGHHYTSSGGGVGGCSPSPRTATIVNATGSVPNGLSGSVATVAAAAANAGGSVAAASAAAAAVAGVEAPLEAPRAAAKVVAAAAAAWGPPPTDDSESVGSGGGLFDF
ncbi:hypothetical protein HXX76_013310 [Chlamydomonas incerta]|uniref:Uncharacterized protein n=1 Tax=Chlamydomonas incerta TaxID=51695 RepID=A0A835VQY5_CHLIN|nr:hypothetical protein HXX76_013310 [Chlamydomonas incerta]|eukprot:KAG2425937.1 hypothetical protein HXX76_013310 [Chlamydomonas incerta]